MSIPPPYPSGAVSRRTLLAAGLGVSALAVAGCSTGGRLTERIVAVESARPHSGRTRSVKLTAARSDVDLGGRVVSTYAYNGQVPGPPVRANVGDQVRINLQNRLPDPTSVHWHGLALRNDMDGVSPVTGDIGAGDDFTYSFSVPDSGTYWFHPHVGIQLDYGLYAPLIVDDPDEKSWYDDEWIVVLDDWTVGLGKDPAEIFESLARGMDHSGHDMGSMGMGGMGSMGGMSMGMRSDVLGGDAGDVKYPAFLINGRVSSDPDVFRAKPGRRIRIRLINASADTAFRVALGGHKLRITHTDGFPVDPFDADAVLLGMGERYDVVVTAGSGAFPLVAKPEGKKGHARAVLRSGAGDTPEATELPTELSGRLAQVSDLTAASDARLAAKKIDLDLPVVLGGNMMSYRWTINGKTFKDADSLELREGQRVRLVFENRTTMWHPMHLHGHTFQVDTADGDGARKDTLIVKPRAKIPVVFDATNPGDWMLHCHNAYHAEAGMMTHAVYR